MPAAGRVVLALEALEDRRVLSLSGSLAGLVAAHPKPQVALLSETRAVSSSSREQMLSRFLEREQARPQFQTFVADLKAERSATSAERVMLIRDVMEILGVHFRRERDEVPAADFKVESRPGDLVAGATSTSTVAPASDLEAAPLAEKSTLLQTSDSLLAREGAEGTLRAPAAVALTETGPKNSADSADATSEGFDIGSSAAGLLGAAHLDNAGAVDAAIQRFLNDLDDMGRSLVDAFTQHDTLPWLLGAGVTAAAALEASSRQSRRARSRRAPLALTHGEAPSWIPGLPESFSTHGHPDC